MDVDDIRARLPQEAPKGFSRKRVVNAGKKGWDFPQTCRLNLRAGSTVLLDNQPPRLQQLRQVVDDNLFAAGFSVCVVDDGNLDQRDLSISFVNMSLSGNGADGKGFFMVR